MLHGARFCILGPDVFMLILCRFREKLLLVQAAELCGAPGIVPSLDPN